MKKAVLSVTSVFVALCCSAVSAQDSGRTGSEPIGTTPPVARGELVPAGDNVILAGGYGPLAETANALDLRSMQLTKWIVVSVERDGETVPAQYGQKVGDIISFEMDNTGQPIFG